MDSLRSLSMDAQIAKGHIRDQDSHLDLLPLNLVLFMFQQAASRSASYIQRNSQETTALNHMLEGLIPVHSC